MAMQLLGSNLTVSLVWIVAVSLVGTPFPVVITGWWLYALQRSRM